MLRKPAPEIRRPIRQLKPKKQIAKLSSNARQFITKKSKLLELNKKIKPLLRDYPEFNKSISVISDTYLNAEKEIALLRSKFNGNEKTMQDINDLNHLKDRVSTYIHEFLEKPYSVNFVNIQIQVEAYNRKKNAILELLIKPTRVRKYHGKGDYNPRIHGSK